MIKYQLNRKKEEGSALVMVLGLAALVSIFVTGMLVSVSSQKSFNRRSGNYEKAIWVAEAGVERLISGLKHNNDNVDWSLNELSTKPAGASSDFWLWKWQTLKDSNGKEYGRYWIEVFEPSQNLKLMKLKVVAQVYDRLQGGKPVNPVQRTIGVELKQLTLGNFAIASNHQMGGTRINGGARIYGGIFTAGHLHMDSSSTGIYNHYEGFSTSQNFEHYPLPETSPEAEVFVYKDNTNVSKNGMLHLSSQAVLGTSSHPMKGIHLAESDALLDPGNGATGTDGDGIIGQGEGKAKGKKDHKMPDVNFPDASAGSQYMEDRKSEAVAQGNAFYSGDIILGNNDITIGSNWPPAFLYNGTTHELAINGPVYIQGNLTMSQDVKYTGKGALFVEGDIQAPYDIVPKNPLDFPKNAALGVIATENLELGQNSGSAKHYAGTFYGNQSIQIQKAKILGNIFGGTVDLPTTGTRPDIYVHPDVIGEVGVPLPDFTNTEIVRSQWWEMKGSAAKL